MRIGIIFGGYSREREISFAGGRTVYDNLDRELFEPVPIFVDSFGQFVLLERPNIYKGSIRDFYPPADFLIEKEHPFQIYAESLADCTLEERQAMLHKLGTPITQQDLGKHIDFAFLCLHGSLGEDGIMQGLLSSLQIPFSGSGILPSAIGINKAFQKEMMLHGGFETPASMVISRETWLNKTSAEVLFEEAKKRIGLPFVSRPANQGSSIGVCMLTEDDQEAFSKAIDNGFFITCLSKDDWDKLESKHSYIHSLVDFREGIGLPLKVNEQVIYHPQKLLTFLEKHFAESDTTLLLEGLHKEEEVIIEEFLVGKEFSCVVLRNENNTIAALPPTEIRKGKEIFDYRSKYLAGLSSKVTPIELPFDTVKVIQDECIKLFGFFNFDVYARIDGFIKEDGRIYLNDPNTTSGMLPSSFFFHQAAEIGLNPSQFLSFIIRNSLWARLHTTHTPDAHKYGEQMIRLDEKIESLKLQAKQKTKVGVILGGYSAERHISVESGRNIYEKLASSEKYEPIPIFLTGNRESFELFKIPINILLKDNADDIVEKIKHYEANAIVTTAKANTQNIREKYAYQGALSKPQAITVEELAQEIDLVFIALHGRPGEDGALQIELEKYHVPYNGSGIPSSQMTIDKYITNQKLRDAGLLVADHQLVYQKDWEADAAKIVTDIEAQFQYPFIAKPVDDGCSAAVKKVDSREELMAFAQMIFRQQEALLPEAAAILELMPKEEFPQKKRFLIEELIVAKEAKYFLEVTGGLLTHYDSDGLRYELFEPSETLKTDAILSLEEKFLAGEGQNITPARYSPIPRLNKKASAKVREDLEKVAKILNIEGYARIDAFVRIFEDESVETIIIEVNSLPGMTPATCIFHQCAINGYKPFHFIDKIIDYSLKKFAVEYS